MVEKLILGALSQIFIRSLNSLIHLRMQDILFHVLMPQCFKNQILPKRRNFCIKVSNIPHFPMKITSPNTPIFWIFYLYSHLLKAWIKLWHLSILNIYTFPQSGSHTPSLRSLVWPSVMTPTHYPIIFSDYLSSNLIYLLVFCLFIPKT